MIVKILAAAALVAAPVSASAPVAPLAPNSTLYSDGTPPVRYQGEASAIIVMVAPERIADICGRAPPGLMTVACTKSLNGVPMIIMPNPCLLDEERFAHILCHEKAHALGWPATHGD